jgi:hypothetical protein
MKVKELKHMLGNYHDEMEIAISEDAEGNTLSPLAEVSLSRVAPVYNNDWQLDFDEDQGTDYVVLWPVN